MSYEAALDDAGGTDIYSSTDGRQERRKEHKQLPCN